VKLSYAHGWRIPGGGLSKLEDAEAGVVRELREEIGLSAYDSVELVTRFHHRPDYRRGRSTLFVIKGVRYQPRWSLEVREVAEFHPDALPTDTAGITLRLLSVARTHIQISRVR
jgi:8-oxo-dGTP pyrophosphatase MutT (NUDIX family)